MRRHFSLRGSCKTPPDDAEVVPPRARTARLLEDRAPSRPLCQGFCKRLLTVLLAPVLGLSAFSAAGVESAVSPLASTFDDLVSMTRQGEWGVAEWARGSMLGIRLFRYGSPGVPYLRGRFLRANDPHETFLSGAYVAIHGQEVDHRRMRAELETNDAKRTLLKALVGDGKAMTASLRDGQQWQPAVDYFPSLGGCRNFTLLCMQSRDELVRRAGLYWGYWVSDAAYWKRVQIAAEGDPDVLTRKFASYLYKLRQAPESR